MYSKLQFDNKWWGSEGCTTQSVLQWGLNYPISGTVGVSLSELQKLFEES